VILNTACKKYTALLEFSLPNMKFLPALLLFLLFFGAGFEVLTVMNINNVICQDARSYVTKELCAVSYINPIRISAIVTAGTM
jgi:hypothetical protein